MFAKSSRYYQVIANDEEENQASHLRQESSKTPRGLWKYILLGLVLSPTILVTTAIVFIQRKHPPPWESCGSSPESARHRDCSFDLISFAWQTPECFDSTLVSEFAAWEEWSFYTEEHGNATIPSQIALQGERNLWVSWHFHMVHCTFMWRQMHRAFERGWIDAHLRAYNHTLHCQKMLLKEGIEDDDFNTNATVIYPVCERISRTSGRNWWDSVYSG
jgi:hypothetical protein